MSNSVTLWTVAHQPPLFMGFSRQKYWSGLPWPLPGHLLNPGTEPASLMSPALAGRFFATSTTQEAHTYTYIPPCPFFFFWISFWNHFPLGSVWDKWTWYREPRKLDDFQMHCMTFPRQLHWLDRTHGFPPLWVPSPKSLLVCFLLAL